MLNEIAKDPQRYEIEKRFIKGIFDDAIVGVVMKRTAPEFFVNEDHRQLFNVLQQYWFRYNGVPRANTLKEVLDNTEGVDANRLYAIAKKIVIDSKPIANDEELFLFDQLERMFRTESYMENIQATLPHLEAYDPDQFEEDMLAHIRTNRIRNNEEVIQVVDYREHWAERKKHIEEKQLMLTTSETSILTGVEPLDNFIGEVAQTDLVIFAATSGGGKSIALENVAIFNAVNKHPGVVITIEMDVKTKGYRFDSHLTRINSRDFLKRSISKANLERADEIISKFRKQMITIIHMPDVCTADLIKRELAILGKSKDIQWIIVDYAQLMIPSNKFGGSRLGWEAQGQITQELKQVCNMLQIPIFTAVQLTEDAREMDSITPKQLAFAKTAVLKDANLLVAILQNEAMRLRDEAKLQILKFREGEMNAELTVKPNYSIVRLHDV